ncbi:DUF3500 domain-containing protein [Acidobacteria bacterium AH-259-O06]|nr:DUF3500 domain-containing protein [Acidobacteria bacterium AH-259-O06]
MKYRFFVFVFLFVIVAGMGAHLERSIVADMAVSGSAFLASLPAHQHQSATFSLGDEERFNWHYIPRSRKGIPLKDLTPAQRKLAHAFLASGLSPGGYIKATQIMFLEELLYQVEGNRARRDPDAYFFSVFGQPSETGTWGWRVEGHHLSLNFTTHDGKLISATPSFWGANPAVAKGGPQAGLRVLATEELLARRLLHSFQADKRKKVMIDVEAPRDIITRASRKAEIGSPLGVAMKEMTKEQAQLLMGLLEVYAQRLRRQLADVELKKLHGAGLDKIHFAWAGGSEAGQPHYYRIQGPTFVVEYDNIQDNANHIHSVWRNFENDFGVDLLKEHYKTSHQ